MSHLRRLLPVLLALSPAHSLPAQMAAPDPAGLANATPSAMQPKAGPAATNTADNTPGHFDFYLLDMPWGPAFCSIKDVGPDCRPQPAFVVHGLWPQNSNGTWPEFCAKTPAPAGMERHLSITPDAHLLQHEWDKHGTCSGLSGPDFFAAEHATFAQVTMPVELISSLSSRTFTPLYVLNMFYLLNPGFPPGSFSLSCKNGHVTAVEACFGKSLQPMRCEGLRSCDEPAVTFDPLS